MRIGKYTGPTAVLFRVDRRRDGETVVVAVFPEEPAFNKNFDMVCYDRGHSVCSLIWMRRTSPATPEEYSDLKKELESKGYKLKVYKRITAKHKEKFNAAVRDRK